jgi:hypothetical protein
MASVKLKPNTNRLRQLCRDHGDVWDTDPIAGAWLMPCFKGELGITIISKDKSHHRNVPFSICEVLHDE